jgi:hypothetical protein
MVGFPEFLLAVITKLGLIRVVMSCANNRLHMKWQLFCYDATSMCLFSSNKQMPMNLVIILLDSLCLVFTAVILLNYEVFAIYQY